MIFVEEHYSSLVELIFRLMKGERYINNNATEITIGGETKTLSISWYVMPGHEHDLSRVLVTIVDITDLAGAKKEILELNEHLEEKVVKRTLELDRANRELEAFSYSVSHDLKAPLRAIKGFSELLKKETWGSLDENSRRYLNHVSENAGNMINLINDLLRFSRMGRKNLDLTEVEMSQLVSAVRDDLVSVNDDDVVFHIHSLPVIRADEGLLRQVFINLISNALKFSTRVKPAEISISGEMRGSDWIFSVQDNGIGFEQKFGEKIFKVFQRLHTSDEYEGSGVGLALVQRIVHRHGGRVWAEGYSGKGATFFFTIPVEIDSE